MKRSYKYRLYPTDSQVEVLEQMLDGHRELYNAALQERRDAWQQCRVSINYYDQANQLRDIRRACPGIAFLNYSATQQTLRRLDKAFKAFFRRIENGEEQAGYPRFKGQHFFNSICYVYDDGLRLKDGWLYIHRVGHIRIFQHRDLPDDAEIKQVVVKREGGKQWYVILQLELPDKPPQNLINPKTIGIDMGYDFFASLSNGEQIENPRWFRKTEEKLGELQRMRSRCKKGSRRHKELSRQIRKTHQEIRHKRLDWHHKLSKELADRFDVIFIEDLDIKGLSRSHVSKSAADAGWRQFLNMLAYKGICVEVNARGISQTCPECGCTVKKDLSIRMHSCSECGYTVPRDVASAQVIEIRGLKKLQRFGTDCIAA